MKKFLQRSLMWLVALVAMFAVSGNAWAQADLLGSNPTFNASGTLDGEYKVTYSVAQGSGLGFAQASTTALYVTKDGQNYGNVSTSVSGYDVTFTVSNSTASVDGKYQIVVPNNYFKTTVMEFFANSNTITINLTGATGGGTVDPDPEQPEQPSGQTLNVTFDFSKGFVAEQDGITCEANGRFNSTYGFYQVQANQHITFTAPYGYLITKMVLNDGNNGYYSAYTVSTGEYESVDNGDWIYYPGNWTGSDASVTFYSNGNNRMKIVAITLVKDPNAKAIFADFTSAFPVDGYTVEELGSIVLGLPAGVTLNPASGSGTIIVNGVEQTTKYGVSESGDLEVAVPYINEDGEYTIVIPRGLVTATDGSINPETTLHYTVASPWFTITKSMINPTPDDAITLARDAQGNVIEAFNAFRIRLDNGLAFATANGSPFQFSYRKDNVNTIVRDAKLYVYSDSPSTATINFASKAITTSGEYTFTIAPESLTTTDGRKNKEPFSWTYTIDQPKAPEFSAATPAAGTTLNKSVKGEYKFQFTQPLQDVSILKASITFPDGESLPFNDWANAAPLVHQGTTTYFTLTLGDNFEQYFADHLKVDGQLTFSFPATCVTSTEGVQNAEEFSVSYNYVSPTFYTYEVVIEGLGENPNAVVSVKNTQYRHHDYVTVAETLLTETDVTYYQLDAYRATLTIRQPADGKIGAIIVSYTEVTTARVQSVSPAEGDFELDAHEDGLTSITVFMDGTWDASVYAGDGNPVPEGVSLVGPEGAVTINASYGFCMWKESNQININHTPYGLTTPGQYTLHIPAGLNTIEGNPNPEMNFTWTVKAASQFSFGYYDTEALGEGEGYNKKTLTGFKLFAPQGVTFTPNSAMKPVIQKVEYAEGEDYMGGEATYTDVPATWNVNTTDNTITITFNEPYTENGSYQFAIPEGCIAAADGRTNKEVSLSAYVDNTVYIDFVATPEGDTTITGPVAGITLTFPEGTNLTGAKFDLDKVSVNGSTTFTLQQPTVAANVVTIPFDEPLNEGYFNYIINTGFATLANGAVSTSAFGYNIYVVAPGIDSDLDRNTYVLFDHVGNSTQDGFTVAATMYNEAGIINIYGAPESFTQGYGLLKINGERHILGVELTIESGELYSVAEANSSDSQFLYEGNTVLWVGSANSLTFSAGGDVYVSQVKVYYDANETIQKACTVGISHYADNCAPGEVKAIPSNITVYMERGAAVQLYTGSDNNTVGVTLNDASGQNLVRQFNTWVGSTQFGIVLDHAITAPGTYTLNVPEGIVRFEDGAYNRPFNLTWTIKALGDLDGNGVTTLSELNTIVNIVLEKAQPVDAADVNNDEEVNIVDIVKVIDQLIEASK